MLTRLKNFKIVARALRFLMSRWYVSVGALAIIGAGGGVAFLYRESIGDTYSSTKASALSAIGLGIAPVALWSALFLWALAFRRSWFWRFNVWLGSAAFAAFLLGVLAFFRPYYGTLSVFTNGGDVSLGGNVGYTIIGSTNAAGAARAAGLLLVALSIAAPRLMLDLGTLVGRGLLFVYVMLIVGAKSAVFTLMHMYRFRPESRSPQRQRSAGASEAAQPSASPTTAPPYRGMDLNHPPGPTEDSPDTQLEPASLAAATPNLALPEPKETDSGDLWGPEVAAGTPGYESPTDERLPDAAGVAGKFNRFWDKSEDQPESSLDPPVATVVSEASKDHDRSPLVMSAATWRQPPATLLVDTPEAGISEEEMTETAETIRRTLAEYSVEVEIGQIKPGPAVTMYGLTPGWIRKYKQVKVTDEHGKPKLDESGKPIVSRVESKTRVKVDSILSREKDLALALKTPSIRIETPVMGRSLVGIEVPNPSLSLVSLRGVMESDEFQKLRAKAKLPIALGRASGGETVVADLAEMPHLLIAGATGSGKSVCINTILSSLIMERSPAEMRLLLVDPKRVELTSYNGIPHLLTPVVVETDKVVALLKGMIREMLERYRRMEEVGVRNIDSYNRKMPDRMPYLVVAIDELADLMMSASFEVEQAICRLAQLGRATGIHLIVATQRPSVDVVTGLIKANFPTRISFGVTSQIDSRTILDSVGAEKLLGRGDMLHLAVDASRPERVQGVFISDREIEDLVEFWHSTPWADLPRITLRITDDSDTGDGQPEDSDDRELRDELLDKAIELAHQHSKMSTSLLQRRMRIGYPRAARLMDELEAEGIVGPVDGSKSRDVIISKV